MDEISRRCSALYRKLCHKRDFIDGVRRLVPGSSPNRVAAVYEAFEEGRSEVVERKKWTVARITATELAVTISLKVRRRWVEVVVPVDMIKSSET